MTLAPVRSTPPADLSARPHDLAAEAFTVGALMRADNEDDFARIVGTWLEADDFYRAANGTIYGRLCDLHARGEPIGEMAAVGELLRHGELETVGGALYVHSLVEAALTIAQGPYFAKEVVRLALARLAAEASERLRQAIATGTHLDDALARFRADLDHIDKRRAALAGCATPSPLRVRTLSRSALATLPHPEPLIDATLDRRTLALLAGAPGVGKSFIALAFGCAVATGTPWLGRATHRAKVLYIAAEGAFGLDDRIGAWEAAAGVTVDDEWFHVLPEPVQLMNTASVDTLVQLVADERYGLVVVDTFARSIVGADENSARDVGVAIEAAERVRRATDDTTALLVHHTGKSGDVRGSTALEGAVDTAYKVEGDTNAIKMSRSKRKEGPREDDLALRLQPHHNSVTIATRAAGEPTDSESFRPTVLMERVSRFLEITPNSSGTAIEKGVQGNAQAKRQAIQILIAEGYIVATREGQATRHTSARPYRKADDNPPTATPVEAT